MSGRGLYFLGAAGLVGAATLAWGVFVTQSEPESATADTSAITAPVKMTKIVVASKPIAIGDTISLDNLTLKSWPEADVPYGAFRTLNQVSTSPELTRTALTPIKAGAPVLDSRLSIAGAQTAIASRLDPGMRAYSIRVDEVSGVAGFILPGSHVDVLHTHKKKDAPVTTRILLTGVQVLAVDRNHNLMTDEPALANTATLAVSLEQARELSIAANDGRLSLALVGAEEANDTVGQAPMPILASMQTSAPARRSNKVPARRVARRVDAPPRATSTPVTVILGDDISEENVPKASSSQVDALLGGPAS
ncbi:MAG: Flp pilus assembly protein CpaB [Hyphomonadaceae bacterium]|nr:Flp pilus assembly protein CpaB [Hyphomonadaceae bacterium]